MAQERVRYERNKDFVFRRIAGEAVLVPIHRDVADMGCIYTLNGVGAFLWEQLVAPASPAELRRAVLEEYDASPEAVDADLTAFLEEMVAIGAVRRP